MYLTFSKSDLKVRDYFDMYSISAIILWSELKISEKTTNSYKSVLYLVDVFVSAYERRMSHASSTDHHRPEAQVRYLGQKYII